MDDDGGLAVDLDMQAHVSEDWAHTFPLVACSIAHHERCGQHTVSSLAFPTMERRNGAGEEQNCQICNS
eukprot:3193168-Amphidinium_carterae.2